ncbi:hypothetical protein GCM10018785_29950 [Streptomyces longispororuber]|uniref:Uncharacterized protein n=1 Tax=Streptomyces longispororuber TaxID=68230 RepID=A0A918ZL96_9ACTN|nr:hypothetical protein GCM10018785_29950 [Streptomyces longispororuber]
MGPAVVVPPLRGVGAVLWSSMAVVLLPLVHVLQVPLWPDGASSTPPVSPRMSVPNLTASGCPPSGHQSRPARCAAFAYPEGKITCGAAPGPLPRPRRHRRRLTGGAGGTRTSMNVETRETAMAAAPRTRTAPDTAVEPA